MPLSSHASSVPPTRLDANAGPRQLVRLREYKPVDLDGGTLLVSVPQSHVGNILFTDYVLEQHRMDQVAALDSEMFPPLAMVHRGKPRFPARVHADAAQRLAVLRCEFTPSPWLARPMALAILEWCAARGVERVVVLDALHRDATKNEAPAERKLWFSGNLDAARQAGRAAGLEELPEGSLAGVPAMLLLEGRFAAQEVLALFAEVREPLDDARSALDFARVLPKVMAGLRIDEHRLQADLAGLEQTVRRLRQAAERATAGLKEPRDDAPSMFG